MRVSAQSAIFLAVLAILSCGGTNLETISKFLKEKNNVKESGSQPILNKLYLMLYSVTDINNQTKLLSYLNLSDFESPQDFVESNDTNKKSIEKDCCTEATKDKDKNLYILNGATKGNNTERDQRLNKGRREILLVQSSNNFTENFGTTASVMKIHPSVASVAIERKKKPGEVGSSAPLLNYIFDTYSNTHYHRNDRVGTGNSIYAASSDEVEAFVGSTAYLDCKVDALHDKLVSWVRRKNDEEPMELLTTGTQQYTTDERYSARFIPPDIWRLEVKNVQPSDAAHYDCQLSAHPPRTARVTLSVPEVSVRIVDGSGAKSVEQVCEVGSTVALRCEVRGLCMEGGPSLLWYRRDLLLNDDTTRGGISVRTEFGANGANSMLRVARVRGDDAGRYTCAVARSPQYSPPPAHVMLHVIKGESLAELHQSKGTTKFVISTKVIVALVISKYYI